MVDKVKWDDVGGGNFTFLSSDGASLLCVVVDDPVKLESKYKGKPQERWGIPVVTDEGFALFVTGIRTVRKVKQYKDRFKKLALMVTRRGAEGDRDATYPVTPIEDKEKVESLWKIAKTEYSPEILKEAVDDVTVVLQQ